MWKISGKIFLTLCAIGVVGTFLVGGWSVFRSYCIGAFDDMPQTDARYTFTTQYGEVFRVTETHTSHWITVRYGFSLEQLVGEHSYSVMKADDLSVDYGQVKLVCIDNSPTYRCYQFDNADTMSNEYLWVRKPHTVYTHAVFRREIDKNDFPVPLARELFFRGNWQYVRLFATYLMQQRDPAVRDTLRRYARGHFTQAELAQNAHSTSTRAGIQQLAKDVLDKDQDK